MALLCKAPFSCSILSSLSFLFSCSSLSSPSLPFLLSPSSSLLSPPFSPTLHIHSRFVNRLLINTQAGALSLRHDRRLLQIPPYLSALCILIGVAWLLLLPLNDYSRRTYVSENAILPGQVHTYFGGSEHNIFRAYRLEAFDLRDKSDHDRSQHLADILSANGLKVAVQNYTYHLAGQQKTGNNVYALLQGPRADATEAMVLMAAWRNMDGLDNYSGVALALTLARYFKRWSIWSKDIIVIIPSDSTFGPKAWVDAYHDTHDPASVASLDIKAGALQAAVAIDYPAGPWGHRFEKLHVVYDGVNGQLPNLDLFNTAVNIATGQVGIGCTIQRMWNHDDSYDARLETMIRGMLSQALGHATGPHSSFMPYHIDAITLQAVGDGWHDEMSLGRVVESVFRSINNLLEHLHQSFFFYLLMHSNRFVSIGTYLPSAMLIAGNFTITAILMWVKSGQAAQPEDMKPTSATPKSSHLPDDMTVVKHASATALVPTKALAVAERDMFLPVAVVFATHALGLLPFYTFNHIPDKVRPTLLLPTPAAHAHKPPLTIISPGIVDHIGSSHGRRRLDPASHRPDPPPRTAPHPPKRDPDPLLLLPPTRRRPVHPRHPQLLPSPLHRPPRRPSVLCPPLFPSEIPALGPETRPRSAGCRRNRRHQPARHLVGRRLPLGQGLCGAACRCRVGVEGRARVDCCYRVDCLVACLGLWERRFA